jgi:hypothetical protein
MRTALARGKADRAPIALLGDADFICKAAGRPLWDFEFGDNSARIAIQREAHLRFPEGDFVLCWPGVDRETAASRRVVVEGGQPYLEDSKTGKRSPIQVTKTAAHWWGGLKTSQLGSGRPMECEAEIEKALGPVPEAEALLAAGQLDIVASLRQQLGERAYLAYPAHGVFAVALHLMGGFERGMIALRERPGLFRSLVEQLSRRRQPEIEAAARAGADAAWVGGYLEGTDLISPRLWREVALPGHRLQVEHARSLGLQVLFWFLGDCMPLLGDLVELGIDGLVLEQGRRGYCSDPVRVRREVGNAFCVYGWVWEMDLIQDDRAAITRTVEEQLRGAARGGAFVMGTPYMTSEVSLGAVDWLCQEVIRVSQKMGYQ